MTTLENAELRVAGVIEESIVDGPGLRFVLFLQGCRTHCPGCQNPQTWDFEGGELVSAQEVLNRIQGDPLVHGVTFSGGEPFEQAAALIPLAAELRRRGYHLTAFSGYTFEQLREKPDCRQLLSLLDLLVDGPFLMAQKSLELRFRGSRNQRILDVQASIAQGWIPILDPLNAESER
ncbi:anaerobic ribonucleoside-triphosphate reductase activating protein [uncultured Mailhella sp.]|uniref:anaerobic ribonucleoside-triphosphate reductase activating protein n=1 Tax=uncultured Mailhella sp. TaxID=1981031 RepID=UPI00262104E7|nr:anaerobic ribonucleoside-triphosphate reductase activating protein [uncultured Mailhella sp.]